ncbi:MAG: hypothetical protein ACNYPI_03130 [Arenicellales bacterium WSBS_2016_MAG_OTU3]
MKLLDELQSFISSIVKSASWQMPAGTATDRKQALAPLAQAYRLIELFTMFDQLGRRKSLLAFASTKRYCRGDLYRSGRIGAKRPKR